MAWLDTSKPSSTRVILSSRLCALRLLASEESIKIEVRGGGLIPRAGALWINGWCPVDESVDNVLDKCSISLYATRRGR
jgi:hypothetical protein